MKKILRTLIAGIALIGCLFSLTGCGRTKNEDAAYEMLDVLQKHDLTELEQYYKQYGNDVFEKGYDAEYFYTMSDKDWNALIYAVFDAKECSSCHELATFKENDGRIETICKCGKVTSKHYQYNSLGQYYTYPMNAQQAINYAVFNVPEGATLTIDGVTIPLSGPSDFGSSDNSYKAMYYYGYITDNAEKEYVVTLANGETRTGTFNYEDNHFRSWALNNGVVCLGFDEDMYSTYYGA